MGVSSSSVGQKQLEQEQRQQQQQNSQAYRRFVYASKSAKTKQNYLQGLHYYMRYLSLPQIDYDLLLIDDSKLIQSKIIDFTIWCRDRQLSYSTVKGYVAKHYCSQNT